MSDQLISFKLNVEQQTKRSGRYDQNPPDREAEVVRWTAQVLGLSELQQTQLFEHREVEILCTGEQFSDWLLKRCERGYCNSFRELQAKRVRRTMPVIPVILARGA